MARFKPNEHESEAHPRGLRPPAASRHIRIRESHLLDHEIDLSTSTRATATTRPAPRLRPGGAAQDRAVRLLAGHCELAGIERACRENVLFMAVSVMRRRTSPRWRPS